MGYAVFFGALAGAMIIFPQEAAQAASQGFLLWARAVAPVLGPFMACMLMLTSRLGGGMWLRAALSWLCGSPGGAKLMQPLKLRGAAALRAAALTGTMSPLFFLGTLSVWLNDPAAGRLILLCHWLGALIVGLCIPRQAAAGPLPSQPLTLGDALKQTALALFSVALCMMLGSAAARMAACAFPRLPAVAVCALQCLLEVTAGAQALISLHSPFTVPLLCAACSLGGLSLLMQNAAFWQESGVGAGRLFLIRLAHGLCAGTCCFLLSALLPFH